METVAVVLLQWVRLQTPNYSWTHWHKILGSLCRMEPLHSAVFLSTVPTVGDTLTCTGRVASYLVSLPSSSLPTPPPFYSPKKDLCSFINLNHFSTTP